MTNEASRVFRSLRFVIPSSFVIRLPRRSPAKAGASTFSGNERGDRKTLQTGADTSAAPKAFTILELLVVIAIIIALAGLILATVGYVQKKGARSRAEAEIAAFSAALESYKADNGIYPQNSDTNTLAASTEPQGGNPNDTTFVNACRYLYKALSGDSDDNPTTSDPTQDTKNYISFKPNMLSPNPAGANTYIRDPFGYGYGYSTAKAADPTSGNGYNPTFDLWSTCGETAKKGGGETFQQYQQRWVKNW
jgi:type II secretory pathway pseudopilin PulG